MSETIFCDGARDRGWTTQDGDMICVEVVNGAYTMSTMVSDHMAREHPDVTLRVVENMFAVERLARRSLTIE